jgi:poly(3-hydroxybutyrate) depolymerase
VAAAGAVSAEPGASIARFEGRDFLLIWPSGTPRSLLIYLHAAEAEPLAYEASSGMLEALAADGAVRGYAVLAPTAARNACGRDDVEPGGERACWRLDAVADELAGIDRLVAFVERNQGVAFETRDLVGYDRGSALLIRALAARGLDRYRKVGLLDAGLPEGTLALGGAAATGPLVYLEAPEGDTTAAVRAGELLRAFVTADYGAKICAKGDAGGRFYDATRLASFLVWFSQDCRRAAPGPVPLVGAPLEGEDAEGSGDDAEGESRRPPRGGPRR